MTAIVVPRSVSLSTEKFTAGINAVNPGLIATEMLDRFSHKDPALEQQLASIALTPF